MKQFAICIAFLFPVSLFACDICNVYMGIEPNEQKNTFSFYYRNRFLHGTVYPEGYPLQYRHSGHLQTSEPQEVKEIYAVYELRFRYFMRARFSATAFLPFVNNYRSLNRTTQFDLYGLGDPYFLAQYQVVNTALKEKKPKLIQRLTAGAGMKLPFGKKGQSQFGKEADPDMQCSTGSLDFLLRADYAGLWKKAGWNLNTTMKINTTGTGNYRYGNVFNANLNVFYQFRFDTETKLAPSIGVFCESARKDRSNGIVEEESGGTVWMGSFGLDFYKGNLALNLAFQPALHNAFTLNQIPVVNRWITGITWNL